jgi:hypothetical protein
MSRAELLLQGSGPSSVPQDRPRSRRRVLLSVAGSVFAVAAAIPLLLLDHSGRSDSLPAGGATVAVPVPACPAQAQAGTERPKPTRRGPLVPSGAVHAVLCRYAFNASGQFPLDQSTVVTDRTADIVDGLNKLPETVPDNPDPDEQVADVCLLGGGAEYRILLAYPTAVHTVRVLPNCGTADADGAVRYLTSLRRMIALWPTSNASSGGPSRVSGQ